MRINVSSGCFSFLCQFVYFRNSYNQYFSLYVIFFVKFLLDVVWKKPSILSALICFIHIFHTFLKVFITLVVWAIPSLKHAGTLSLKKHFVLQSVSFHLLFRRQIVHYFALCL